MAERGKKECHGEFDRHLQAAAEARGLSLYEVTRQAGLAPATLQAARKKDGHGMKVETLAALCGVLGIEPRALFPGLPWALPPVRSRRA